MAQQWILRKGSKENGFRYVSRIGHPVRSKVTRARIDGLRIPPAWREVHIAASPRAAIQAWGLDARGRKQYRYHTRAVAKGELKRHHRLRQLAKDLKRLKGEFYEDFHRRGFPREKVCAGILGLITDAFFRVGSERYERENNTFGITTLRKSHVFVDDDMVIFNYLGKRAIRQRQVITSPEMAGFVKSLLRTPGWRLFRYEDDGEWFNIDARDVNSYLKNVAQFPYTAKDLRTWGGTLRMAIVLETIGTARNEQARKKNVVTAIRLVAAELGNTPAICRRSYVHPVLISRYLQNGSTIEVKHPKRVAPKRSPFDYTPEEEALKIFLAENFPDRRISAILSAARLGRTRRERDTPEENR